jgi:hypothetical protein
MISLGKAGIGPISADLDSVAAAGLNDTRPETRGSPARVALEAMEQQSRNLGFTVQQYRAPKAAE